MTEEVIIREVKSVEIWLHDSDIDEFSWREALIKIPIILIVSILIGYFICSNQLDIDIFGASAKIGIVICVLLILLGFAFGIFDVTFPAYRVSTNADIDSIYIKKTTEEADQIAICKAATEIENQIKARAEDLQKLKQIAEKCK
jgi:uncharacterized protein YneF (UPF0154 family)